MKEYYTLHKCERDRFPRMLDMDPPLSFSYLVPEFVG